MRISLVAGGCALLLLAGCGGSRTGSPPESDSSPTPTSSTPANASRSESDAPPTASADAPESNGSAFWPERDPLPPSRSEQDSPPDVAPEAAPDLAFGYRYSFGLAADRIGSVQQRHARLCEELGRDRCQVTGISYRRKSENNVQAELKLALDPGLAHRFGERVLDSVRDADGDLVDSEVTGTDVGSGIRTDSRTIADLNEQLNELEQRIADARTPALRQSLELEAAGLRQRIRSLRDSRSDARARLATTPVTLTYSSVAYASSRPDFGGAIGTGWNQLKWLGYGLFALAMLLGPWALAGVLIWLAVRGRRRRSEAAPIA
jgi:hypothetical protein